MRRIINIVDRLDRVNFGIWNAAVATAIVLRRTHGLDSEIWYPATTDETRETELTEVMKRALPNLRPSTRLHMVEAAGLDPAADLIISHGCWQYPTRWGAAYKKMGFCWMAVPHGMLEPWSFSQKRLVKTLYYALLEKPALTQADRIRAVGRPEFTNLQADFGERTIWIPNGIPDFFTPERKQGNVFLFMSRLHHKKGVLPLLEGWRKSQLSRREDCELRIAGPDDGEKVHVENFLHAHRDLKNVAFIGAVYGREKQRQLEEASFYVLPSHSEGFPTSVLEAMAGGLIPLISGGCNFPDVLEMKIGIQIEPEAVSVKTGLEAAFRLPEEEREKRRAGGLDLLKTTYTYEKVASRQVEEYTTLMNREVQS